MGLGFNIALIIEIIIIFLIGLFVYLNSNKNKIIYNFIYLIIAIELWVITSFLLFASIGSQCNIFIFKLSYVVAGLMSYMIFVFVKDFPNQLYQKNSFLNKILPFISISISLLCLSDITIKNVDVFNGIIQNVSYGSFYYVFIVYIIFLAMLIFYTVYKQYQLSKSIPKVQARYVFAGIVAFIIFAVTTDVLMPFFTKSIYAGNLGIFGLLFIVITVAYSILAHHLFDIRVIIKKTLVYSGLLAFVLVTYALIVMSISIVLSGQLVIFGPNGVLSLKMFVPNLIAAILIAVGFNPLEKWLSDYTDKWLFKGEYKEQEVLSKLSDNLSTVIDLNEALESMMRTITEALRVKTVATFVLTQRIDTNKGNTHGLETNNKVMEVKRIKSIGYDMEDKKIVELIHPVTYYFQKHPKEEIIITDELERKLETSPNANNKDLIDFLKNLNAALAMPIKVGENPKRNSNDKIQILNETQNSNDKTKSGTIQNQKIIGLFVLGEKLSGDVFSEKDLNLLDIAVKQTATAIEKARFYEEDQLKSEFVSIASHELLTPTSAIEGYLSMILDEHLAKVDKRAEGYLRKVYASSKRLAALVKDLLNVSRIESGRIIIKWQAFDIVELIKTVVEELEPKAKEKKLELIFSNPKSEAQNPKQSQNSNNKNSKQIRISDFEFRDSRPGRVMVFADEERAHQVLVNLIGNAVKYTEHGSVHVTCNMEHVTSEYQKSTRHESAHEPRRKIKNQNDNDTKSHVTGRMSPSEVVISVTDTGMGMREEDQKHLFEKFYRAPDANKYGAGGTGLGLYISKNIAELMGGRIWVKSAEGKGSTFYFSLKLATSDEIKNHSSRPQGDGFIPAKKT